MLYHAMVWYAWNGMLVYIIIQNTNRTANLSIAVLNKLISGNVSLTHWGRVKHICVTKLTIIGSDNGLSPGRRQTMIWTNAGILFTGALGTNASEIWIEIYTFWNTFENVVWKRAAILSRPQCDKCASVVRLNINSSVGLSDFQHQGIVLTPVLNISENIPCYQR